MDRATLLRASCLYLPILVAVILWSVRRPGRREAAGILLSMGWTLPALMMVHLIAQKAEWWTFADVPGRYHGIPVDLLLGWVLLWGAIPVLAFPRTHPLLLAAGFFWLDLLTMPRLDPLLTLGPGWLIGDLVAIVVVLLPALLLYRWTSDRRRLAARGVMQCILFSSLALWLLPDVILLKTGGNWERVTTGPGWITGLLLQLLALPALLGATALHEFIERGRGTPVPFDPPERLVRSGPYAYVTNPMQLSIVLLLTGLGAIVMSPWVSLAGAMGFVYSAGLAAWDEGEDLQQRFGEAWRVYRRQVRAWLPRWRPYDAVKDGAPEAALYVAFSCGKCSEVGQFLQMRHPIGLAIVPAESHPRRDLSRMTYDPRDGGPEEEGVAAFARALEHLNLGWAIVAWTIRFPLLRPLIQLLADASGMGPMGVTRTTIGQGPPEDTCAAAASPAARPVAHAQ